MRNCAELKIIVFVLLALIPLPAFRVRLAGNGKGGNFHSDMNILKEQDHIIISCINIKCSIWAVIKFNREFGLTGQMLASAEGIEPHSVPVHNCSNYQMRFLVPKYLPVVGHKPAAISPAQKWKQKYQNSH